MTRLDYWAKENEKELALVWAGFLAGYSFGKVAGRHSR